ncbi:unnamed protein product [Blumeria hordei]|uniref:cyclin-dependent kinase n=1 Tax=Blumeria hordei TaxID=2867405 RepID=A0A383UV91_BLUHO|nr:unnamed protein product [Blumeria hordei]
MKENWSHVEDRRDRGRVDRGAPRPRSSRSPTSHRQEGDRIAKARDRSPLKSRPISQHHDAPRESSHERRRRRSRTPIRDSREVVRERNRGRELLDTRGSTNSRKSITNRSPSSSKRRRLSRTPSPPQIHNKKSKRGLSKSPVRFEGRSEAVPRLDRRKRTISPALPRKRSPDRSEDRFDSKPKRYREVDRRGRSPSPKIRHNSRRETYHKREKSPKRLSSPYRASNKARDLSPPDKFKERGHRREETTISRGRSPDIDWCETSNLSRQYSPRAPRGPKSFRGGHSPRRGGRGGRSRDEFRYIEKPEGISGEREHYTTGPSAKSIEGKGSKPPSAVPASGANSFEIEPKMAGRGYYGSQQDYNPHYQMQAAFPLKPQYSQRPPPMDSRQYSQSPQHHLTPGSYHGSPAQSPYHSNRGNWGGHTTQHQYSPPPQYPPSYQQQHNYSNSGYQPPYLNQSPPYYSSAGQGYHHSYQQSFRGSRGGYRGNNFIPRGGRGDHRGGRVTHFKNLQWNSSTSTNNQNAALRGKKTTSVSVTALQKSPKGQLVEGASQHAAQSTQDRVEEEAEEIFRPSKDLQVEDKEVIKKKDEEQMPPPKRSTPTGPQNQQNSLKFSFAFKGPPKFVNTTSKPTVSSKISSGTSQDNQASEKANPASPQRLLPQSTPTEPRIPRYSDPTEPDNKIHKVKKIVKRIKEKPQLSEEFKKSDSIYFRKPGNESVVGSGTYGKVFKAVHIYTKKLVALKKIRMEGERDGFPVTAVREIKLLQSLKHQNIVNLQEVMVEKNDCFMVFEYLSHDLTGLLNHPTFKLEPAYKKHLAMQLFQGLDYLHRRGVLHRDIKAANILVSNRGLLKLTDFGLARFYAKRKQLDYTNRVITIWYRSPELLLGETQYGPAVDIWSAACVLVEIFTRHAIFPGDGGEISQLEKIYAVLGTPNRIDWPGLVDMAWFELLRPASKKPNVFSEKYRERLTPQAYELLQEMFQYDPAKRPSACDILEHAYFKVEQPKPEQAIHLASLDGDWHEFESKALRKENERKDKEAKRQALKSADKKRVSEIETVDRDTKRPAAEPILNSPALIRTKND